MTILGAESTFISTPMVSHTKRRLWTRARDALQEALMPALPCSRNLRTWESDVSLTCIGRSLEKVNKSMLAWVEQLGFDSVTWG